MLHGMGGPSQRACSVALSKRARSSHSSPSMRHSRLPSADVTVKLGGDEKLGALVGGPPLLPALTCSCKLRSV